MVGNALEPELEMAADKVVAVVVPNKANGDRRCIERASSISKITM